MKKKWKNLIVLCLAATLACFLPVRMAEAVEDNSSLPTEVSVEDNSNLMLEAVPEENCNLPLEVSVENNSNLPSEGNGGIMPLDDEAGDEEENDEESSGSEELLDFVGIKENITYLKDVSFQVIGSPTKVTIKEVGQDGEGDVLTAESGDTYKVTVDGREGTYIITAVKETIEDEQGGQEREEIYCSIKISSNKEVLSSGTYALTKGQAYKLGTGSETYWRVLEEDYRTAYYGGCSFYVSADKDYNITKSGWGLW